jgi:hypothetical protein
MFLLLALIRSHLRRSLFETDFWKLNWSGFGLKYSTTNPIFDFCHSWHRDSGNQYNKSESLYLCQKTELGNYIMGYRM